MDLSATHLHLMLNHLPVIGTGLVLLIMLWGVVRRSRDVLLTGLGLTVLLALAAPVVKKTGEDAEEQVEKAAWFDEDMVHEHEERGETAVIVLMVTGVIALAGVVTARGGRDVRPVVAYAATAFLAASAALMAWTALAGGRIRHEEIRPGAVQAATPGEGDDR
ncbi:MAG: hypothetical protein ACOY71_13170 [Gemmatimonadota bacterium]